MVGVAERTTEQRKLQTVAGRESPTKDKKRDGEWFHSTARQLMAKVNMTTLEWPARNPDLNLIENVWEMLAQLVNDGHEITKEAQLWERILGAKKQLIETRRDVIVHMFDHYEERLIKVIEKKGDITDY